MSEQITTLVPVIPLLQLVPLVTPVLHFEAVPPYLIVVIEVHPENAPYPMLVTLLGIVTSLSETQPKNAFWPILDTGLYMVTDVKLVHP